MWIRTMVLITIAGCAAADDLDIISTESVMTGSAGPFSCMNESQNETLCLGQILPFQWQVTATIFNSGLLDDNELNTLGIDLGNQASNEILIDGNRLRAIEIIGDLKRLVLSDYINKFEIFPIPRDVHVCWFVSALGPCTN